VNGIRGFGNINFPVEAKIVKEKVIIDIRNFEPCHPKEIEEWSWRYMKNEKWLVHVTNEGYITKEKIRD